MVISITAQPGIVADRFAREIGGFEGQFQPARGS
jgi:hypothetical protein